MRVVIDTNILVSYLFWPDAPMRPLVDEILQQCVVLRSSETFAELTEVIMRRKFDRYLSIAQREIFLAGFYDISTQVVIKKRITACRDPKDDKFLELAVDGKAKLIFTGDNDLLDIKSFKSIKIVRLSAASIIQ